LELRRDFSSSLLRPDSSLSFFESESNTTTCRRRSLRETLGIVKGEIRRWIPPPTGSHRTGRSRTWTSRRAACCSSFPSSSSASSSLDSSRSRPITSTRKRSTSSSRGDPSFTTRRSLRCRGTSTHRRRARGSSTHGRRRSRNRRRRRRRRIRPHRHGLLSTPIGTSTLPILLHPST